jgi:hypothetical protein
MATIDYKVTETEEGQFDINLPMTKVVALENLLFQQVDLLLETYTEEFLYDVTQGMPYDDILDKSFDLTTLETIYYDKIKVLVYFKDMEDFLIDIDEDRNYLISFVVIAQNDAAQSFSFSTGI